MFKRIHIQNYRSCHDVNLESLGLIIALVGRNGAGKTNILRGIEWMSRVAVSTDPISFDDHRSVVTPTKVSAEIAVHEGVFRYALSRDVQPPRRGEKAGRQPTVALTESLSFASDGQAWTSIFNRSDETLQLASGEALRTAASTPCLPVLATVLPKEHPTLQQILPLTSFLHGVRYYPMDEPSALLPSDENAGPIRGDMYAAWVSRYKATGNPGTSVVMRLLHMFLEKKDKLDELKNLLGEEGINVIEEIEIDHVDIGGGASKDELEATRRFYFVQFLPSTARGSDDGPFDYVDLSAGTRRMIRILVSLVFDESSVMLIEQPEDSIHAGLMKKLVGLLRANVDPAQLMVATHSPSVFNRLEPTEVRLVTISAGNTEVRVLTPQELTAAEAFITNDGSLAEFLDTVGE